MPTAHSTLTGSDLHEVKGASGATAGHVYRADGAGSASFVDPSTLSVVTISSSLSNSNTSSISPSATDTPVTAGFSSTEANSDVSMDSSGLITILTPGLYELTFNCNIGRSNSTGTAIIAARLLINGTQFGFTQSASIATSTTFRPVQFNVTSSFSALDTLQVQVLRDSAGNNDGGFVAQAITLASWGDSPSYFVRVNKLAGGY